MTLAGGVGYSERPPTLTELYAAQTFMYLLQNGLNTVTGNPLLDKERLWQVDLGLRFDNGHHRAGLNGFHAWVNDYITYENIGLSNPEGPIDQVNLKFVNTDLATLAGFEFFSEFDVTSMFTTFALASYVEGRDHTRDGDFATMATAGAGSPSIRVPSQARGSYGGINQAFVPDPGSAEEPLPSMPPLESRIGIRLHGAERDPSWNIELSARIVDQQNRVATSLLEGSTAGFTLWDLRSFWQVNDRILLVGGVENLTNKNYREYLDFRPIDVGSRSREVFQPGVNFYFGSEVVY